MTRAGPQSVFVSYRRADTLWAAHLLGYALRAGGHSAFVDTGSIGGGEHFPEAIARAVAGAHVMLALIGPAFDAPRLREPGSVVAFEWRRARFHGIRVVPVLVDGATMPEGDALPPELRWFANHNAYALRPASPSSDVDALVADIPVLSAEPRRAARVLWVDDKPANNEVERARLRRHGIVFDNVVSSAEALEQLGNERYDLVITDLVRTSSSDRSLAAGTSLLAHAALRQGGPPVIIYAGSWALERADELIAQGALAVLDSRHLLIDTVMSVLGRGSPPAALLAR